MQDRRQPASRALRALRGGFTLLEMLTVIMIIGILSTYLVVKVPTWIDNAKQTACQANMRRLYTYLVSFQGDHDGAFPNDDGQRFFIRVWKAGLCEHTENDAMMFFCPSEPPGQWLDPDQDAIEVLDDWDNIGPNTTSYAGFSDFGDRSARRNLRMSAGSTTILSDNGITHRTGIIYMTADGVTHKLTREDVEERLGAEWSPDLISVGPGSELEELRTVSNE